MTGSICYDLIMTDEMDFIEGSYRISNDQWHVVIANKKDITNIEVIRSSWESGAKGLVVHFPVTAQLNRKTLETVLSDHFGIDTWIQERGPDSMNLR